MKLQNLSKYLSIQNFDNISYVRTLYYRRKILLSILHDFGGKLSKIDLQKLLFLFTMQQKDPDYFFIPYKFGCYSYLANQDLNTLQKYNKTSLSGNNWLLLDKRNYLTELKKSDFEILKTIRNQFYKKLGDELIKYTYNKYPYYAINSNMLNKLLNKKERADILYNKPCNNIKGLYTIGYEGISLEEYLNKLIKYDIKVLCDVRKNPISMKFGFSKNQLKNACENIGIKYLHFPGLGIESDLRKKKFANNYKELFNYYRKNILNNKIEELKAIIELIAKFEKVAITCFEADLNCCHRLHLAEELSKIKDWKYTTNHI